MNLVSFWLYLNYLQIWNIRNIWILVISVIRYCGAFLLYLFILTTAILVNLVNSMNNILLINSNRVFYCFENLYYKFQLPLSGFMWGLNQQFAWIWPQTYLVLLKYQYIWKITIRRAVSSELLEKLLLPIGDLMYFGLRAIYLVHRIFGNILQFL